MDHPVVSREEWRAAREELLRREKEHTRLGDELARQRRELPWVRVEKEYTFETEAGPRTLPELFADRGQLLVYHFMFGPGYEAGCPVCSSSADAVNGVVSHLNARDVTMLYVSRAPLGKLQAYRRRMGWSFPWVSCAGSDFNFDFGFSYTDEQVRGQMGAVLDDPSPALRHIADQTGAEVAEFLQEGPGFSAFIRDDRAVYHSYSTTARGLEFLMGYYPILDRAPRGRDEEGAAQLWLRRHDEYGVDQ